MKKLIKIALILNYLLWGGVFLYSLFMYFSYNGILNLFNFTCQKAENYTIEATGNRNSYKIFYEYMVGENKFEVVERVAVEVFNWDINNSDKLEICYNATFPSLSYIDGANIALRKHKGGMVVGFIFIAFFAIIDLLFNKDYWANKYKAFSGNKD